MARENGSRKSRNNSRCTQVAPYHVHLVTSPCLSTGHPTKLTQSMNKKALFSEHKLVGFIINKLLGFSITTKHSTQNCCSSHQDLQVWLLVSCGFIFGFFYLYGEQREADCPRRTLDVGAGWSQQRGGEGEEPAMLLSWLKTWNGVHFLLVLRQVADDVWEDASMVEVCQFHLYSTTKNDVICKQTGWGPNQL